MHIANGKAVRFERKQQHPGVVNLDLARVIPESIDQDGEFSKMKYPFTPYCTFELVYGDQRQNWSHKAISLTNFKTLRLLDSSNVME